MQTNINKGNLSATINHKGAELVQFSKAGRGTIWEVDEQYWNKTSPILFPIVGALKNGEYVFDDQRYQLPRHGFARDYEFELIEKTENSAEFSLKFNNETLKVYPFEFELKIKYELSDNQLNVIYTVINLSDKEMLYSIGAHPAFKLQGDIESYTLKFDDNKPLKTYLLDKDLFSGETKEILLNKNGLPLNYQLFEQDALVFKNQATSSLSLLKNGVEQLSVHFQDFPYLGIWTKSNAPFICIEPWLGIADNANASGNLNEKEGIQRLKPKSEHKAVWRIEIF